MFDEWKYRYDKMIYHILHHYRICYDFDEFYQLALIKLWQLEQQFDENKSTNQDQYVYLKLKFYIIDELRKKIKYQQRFIAAEDEQLIPLLDSEHPYFQLYIDGIDQVLSTSEQFWLTHTLYGYSTKEIAVKAGRSPSTIKAWRKSAREKLYKNLNLTFKSDD